MFYIAYCFDGQPCKPWDLTALGDAAADTWAVTYKLTERDGTWILLDDFAVSLAMRENPPWVPNGPKYDDDFRDPNQ